MVRPYRVRSQIVKPRKTLHCETRSQKRKIIQLPTEYINMYAKHHQVYWYFSPSLLCLAWKNKSQIAISQFPISCTCSKCVCDGRSSQNFINLKKIVSLPCTANKPILFTSHNLIMSSITQSNKIWNGLDNALSKPLIVVCDFWWNAKKWVIIIRNHMNKHSSAC